MPGTARQPVSASAVSVMHSLCIGCCLSLSAFITPPQVREPHDSVRLKPQERRQETTKDQRRAINVKCDAKFYVILAARGKANAGLYSDIS